MLFANIIVDISLEKLDKPFGYIIPDRLKDKVIVGSVVHVPFGNGKRIIKGFVIEITDVSDFPVEKMKEILDVDKNSSDMATSRLIELAAWIKKEYGSTMNQALKTVLPVRTKIKNLEKKSVKLLYDELEARDALEKYKKRNSKAKIRLITELIQEKCIDRDIVVKKLNISQSTLNSMVAEGAISVESQAVYRKPVKLEEQGEYDIVLNEQQQIIADNITMSMDRLFKKEIIDSKHLIHGITGSGKTEIYISLIDECIKRGREAIVLIPEIALTYQTVKRFTKKFGEKVSIINSKLSKGERYDQFERARKGQISIMIGPRSALFTPFENLGLIIIDEEHENSYKSETVPKYHAREVAVQLGKMTNSVVILGSATPSLEAYYGAENNKYSLHKLNVRGKGSLSDVTIVDLRDELKNGNKTIFSYKLQEMIADRLNNKQQVMLFINRRGYAGFISCRECGTVIKCPHCDVSLKAHNNGKLMCHYCGYEMATPKLCPKCGSKYIAGFGTGTQKVESEIKKMFPQARVLRMDMDTTSKKGGHEEILAAFANHDADILVGTQMIVKGHDFPNVTLVGVLAADMSLYASDYRAAERTFQLLTQAAGRAGRGNNKGDVIIQTYDPDNYSIVYSKEQNYEKFYQEEIAYRTMLQYPPVANMTAIVATSEQYDLLDKSVNELVEVIKKITGNLGVAIIGPANASVAKINDVYRKVIYLKHYDNNVLIEIKDKLELFVNSTKWHKNVMIQFDFMPSGNY